ncbi:uncharacterized protein LOC134239170 [Saccostrea cucullata]|uniref:uncharacterized protein LOC134239170 n=1 Tax=Saccostrea cuccullata TaxID=36930 RepID=UPI002ED3F714
MESSVVSSLVHMIQTYSETAALKACIEKANKKTIEQYKGENGMDVLHLAIIANNVEAVSLLFHKGIFKPPHESSSFPYMHLAARLGHKTILNMLLQERPLDNVPAVFNYKSTGDRYKNKADDREANETKQTPLDLAGKSGHVGCIKTILDHFHGKFVQEKRFKGNEAYIEMACQLDSPFALCTLLSDRPSDEEIKSAVGAALKNARPECLDVLLQLRTDLSTLFEGMNLFHVLYSYTLSFDKKWYERLLAVTTILIKHGHNVGASIPFRTYPLYSLLSHSACHDFDNSSNYIIACSLLLLNAGADPNFDELQFEKDFEDMRIRSAFGRCGFSSGLHCLFQTVEQYALQMQGYRYLKVYMSKCAAVLLKHRGNPNYVGEIDNSRNQSGNSLHALSRTIVLTGVDDKLIKLLLQNGADPNLKIDDHFPLTVLTEKLFELDSEDQCLLRASDVENIKVMINAMSPGTIQESLKIMDQIEKDKEPFSHKQDKRMEVYNKIKSYCMESVANVRSLKRMCMQRIFTMCDRKVPKVLKLPLPTTIKMGIVEFQ